MSRLRRYRAHSLQRCLEAARRDFGPDAIIHAVRARREGFLLLGRRTVHELLAGPAESLARIEAAGGIGRERSLRGAAALRAYAGSSAGSPALRNTVGGTDTPGAAAPHDAAEIDRRRTRLLAQAMAIRLERDAQARRLAAANERAVDADAGRSVPGLSSADPDSSETELVIRAEDATASPAAAGAAQRFVLVPAADAARETAGPRARVAPPTVAQLAHDLRALRSLVERVVSAQATGQDLRLAEEYLSSPAPWSEAIDAAHFGAPLAGFYATLIGHAMSADLARKIIEEALGSLEPDQRDDPHAARAAVRARVAALLPACPEESAAAVQGLERSGRPHVISLVGPTGTGKTTTLAKLAADFALRRGRSVGLITTDTFRICAVDQLRTYAEIVGLPLHVAEDAQGLRRAREALSDREVILVDTAGRGHGDRERIAELGGLLRAACPDETHLVLSSTAAEPTLLAEAAAFAGVGVDRVVVAKLDEAVGFGVLIGALSRIGRPLSWLTTGQQVPDDLEPARAERLADLLLGGAKA